LRSFKPPHDAKRWYSYLCKLDAADQDYAGNKWKPCGAAPAPDCKWFPLPDILGSRAQGVASWVLDIVKNSNDPQPQDRSHASSQGPNARQNVGPAGGDAAAASSAQPYNKAQVGPSLCRAPMR
jgi:hypothetical protein